MMDRELPAGSPRELDALLADEAPARWDRFFGNRARPVPFFGTKPDENLQRWVLGHRLPPGRALDIGCGNGRNAIFLARHGWTVDGVDHSTTALQWAAEECARAQASVSLRACSVFEMALHPGSYDLVYDGGCFHHISPHRREQYVRIVADALRPGGMFAMVCFRPEGGSGYSDREVYERRSLGGGLGYDEPRLRAIWSPLFELHAIEQMREQPPGSELFGKDFLWTMLASRR